MSTSSRFVVFLVEGRRYAVRLDEVERLVAAVHVLPPESIAFLLRDCGRRAAPVAKASA